ncbi:IclR family transcriptional regulator [Roseiarcus fermentans]|uniref:IclR family transcriptional regulator n=1 Tax=Roseiarcus fermentans TaxID=1473586 RepID=UPI001474C0DF|nr:IclR family transcriptional regulator [Roseiarcus fermentans]
MPAVERASQIMDLVARAPQGLSASEIARRMGIAKSSAHSLCGTLSHLNLLTRRSDQSFHLGPHIMRWANAFSERSDVAAEFVTIWDEGTQFPGATITLSVLEGTEVVYIAARNSHVLPGFEFRAGMRLPAAFTATGKAFLSAMTDPEVRRLFAYGFPAPLTERSPKTVDHLLKDIAACRKRGYSIDDEGVKEGMVCFGYPVLNSRNRPIAGLAVSLPKRDFDDREIGAIVSNVREIAQKISIRLGAQV